MKSKKLLFQSLVYRRMYTHRLIIGIIAGTVLIGGGYVLSSKYVWDSYQTKQTQWHADMQHQVDTALALPVATDKNRADKLVGLKKTSDTIRTTKDLLCKVNPTVEWQQFIQSLRSSEEKCRATVGSLTAFNEKLQAVANYLEDDRTLAGVMSKVPYKAELTEVDWDAQVAAWHEASSKVEALAVQKDFIPIKQIAQSSTKEIDISWQELVAAHKAKDKARYIKAQSQLMSAYGSIKDISGASSRSLTALLDSLGAAYKNTF